MSKRLTDLGKGRWSSPQAKNLAPQPPVRKFKKIHKEMLKQEQTEKEIFLVDARLPRTKDNPASDI